jgi:hypothetical protein
MFHYFDIDIAKQIGIPAAVMFSHIYHWILHNETNGKHNHDGKFWTFNSMAAFQMQMPYLSERSIRTALTKLIDAKYIITGNYNTSPLDRTIWYALGEVGEAFKSRDLQGESPICQNEQMHLSKMANAFVKNDEPIPVINDKSIGTSKSSVNNISTGSGYNNAHTCACEKQKYQRITFGYDTDWKFAGITEQLITYWQEHYPQADVRQELLRMEAWLFANKQHRKTRIESFITNWLNRTIGDKKNGYSNSRAIQQNEGKIGQNFSGTDYGVADDYIPDI